MEDAAQGAQTRGKARAQTGPVSLPRPRERTPGGFLIPQGVGSETEHVDSDSSSPSTLLLLRVREVSVETRESPDPFLTSGTRSSAQALLALGLITPIPSRSSCELCGAHVPLLFAEHCLYFIIISDYSGHVYEREEFRVTRLPLSPEATVFCLHCENTKPPSRSSGL